jgi:hypothetical protein
VRTGPRPSRQLAVRLSFARAAALLLRLRDAVDELALRKRVGGVRQVNGPGGRRRRALPLQGGPMVERFEFLGGWGSRTMGAFHREIGMVTRHDGTAYGSADFMFQVPEPALIRKLPPRAVSERPRAEG